MKVKPDFFIIGAAKSGTTSLYEYLKQSEDIYFSPIKEPNYFSDDIDVSKFSKTYRRNTFLAVDKYFKENTLHDIPLTFIRNKDYYEQLFLGGTNYKIRGEASTSYLYSKTAAKNIYNFNQDSKIIAILRNPMGRAFSHYQMAVRYGHTNLDFKNAVKKDHSRDVKGWGISELFIELGLYFEQLERYFKVFPKEQIKIFLFDDLKSDPQKFVNECCNFIGISEFELDNKSAHNVKEIPENIKLNYFLTKSGIKSLVRKVLPKSTTDELSKSFYKKSKIRLNREDFNFLLSFYKEDIEKTASLLNLDLSYWLNYDNL